jgi:hypothetical protein
MLKKAIRIFPVLAVAVLLTTFALGLLITGAEQIIKAMCQRWPWLMHLFTDGAYDRERLISPAAYPDFVIEIVRKLSDQEGFKPLPRRWVVERTFGWMTRWRRLVRDYKERCDFSGAMVGVAMSSLMLRRIAHP